jgi:hypothetical protein
MPRIVLNLNDLTREDREQVEILQLALTLELPSAIYVGITLEELFALCFNNNCGESNLPNVERDIIQRDVAKYRTEKVLPGYVTRLSRIESTHVSRR